MAISRGKIMSQQKTLMAYEVRASLICGLIMATVFFFLVALMLQCGAVLGANPEADILREKAINELNHSLIIEGSIIDTNGETITYAETAGQSAQHIFPEEYGFLIGYNNRQYGKYALRGKLDSFLYGSEDETGRGCTVRLTTSNRLQTICYQAIGTVPGSAIILENKTGRILALASRAEILFNPNRLSEKMDEYNSHEGFFLQNGWTEKDPPGSIFKIITSACALENTLTQEELEFVDTGALDIPGGSKVHNFRQEVHGMLDLQGAFSGSVNTYFANLAMSLGAARLEETMEKFMLGSDIELDFTTLRSSRDLGNRSPFLIAQTGFGQGRLQLTPLHLAMITQCVANDGTMLKPYLIEEIREGGKRPFLKGRTEVLSKAVDKKTAKALQEMMEYTAESRYRFSAESFGRVGAKTGTAELGNGMNHVYLCVFTEEYTIVLSRNRVEGASGQLTQPMKTILDYLYVQ